MLSSPLVVATNTPVLIRIRMFTGVWRLSSNIPLRPRRPCAWSTGRSLLPLLLPLAATAVPVIRMVYRIIYRAVFGAQISVPNPADPCAASFSARRF